MPRHEETRLIPYTPVQLFELVADVSRYPEFLPWVIGSRITSRSDTALVADLIIGFKMFREKFTSKVLLEKPQHIHVDYLNGPLKYLRNDWRFNSDNNGGTVVEFFVEFEFKNRLFETIVGALFTEAVRRMVGAFEKRAAQLYGAPAAPPKISVAGYQSGV